MINYLQSPIIQIGAYWHGISEVESYRSVFKWLQERGYQMDPEVLTVQSHGGRIPRGFNMYTVDKNCLSDCTPEKVVNMHQSIPVFIRLRAPEPYNFDIDLCYGIMDSESTLAGESFVIEIFASGADLDLVRALGASGRDEQVIRKAKLQDQWRTETLTDLFNELKPDYAGERLEFALQPPHSLVAVTPPPHEFLDTCISHKLEQAGSVRKQLANYPFCSITDLPEGIHIASVEGIEMDPHDGDSALKVLHCAFNKVYGLNM